MKMEAGVGKIGRLPDLSRVHVGLGRIGQTFCRSRQNWSDFLEEWPRLVEKAWRSGQDWPKLSRGAGLLAWVRLARCVCGSWQDCPNFLWEEVGLVQSVCETGWDWSSVCWSGTGQKWMHEWLGLVMDVCRVWQDCGVLHTSVTLVTVSKDWRLKCLTDHLTRKFFLLLLLCYTLRSLTVWWKGFSLLS